MVQSLINILRLLSILCIYGANAYNYSSIAIAYINADVAVLNFASDYDTNLEMSKVVRFFCANPTTKIFTEVFISDQNMTIKLDFTYPIAFVTHGWNDTPDAQWIVDLADTWISLNYTNVCRVGWATYAATDYISAATLNVKMVGGYFAEFVRSLHNTNGVPFNNITIAGHSLGAHVAGSVGFNLQGQIKRIFGMDPAGPLFSVPLVAPTKYRLDRSDAHEVVIIHTCDGVLGIDIPCGHTDFFPDGGTYPQPGCTSEFGTYGLIDTVSCAHFRSVQMFHNSLRSSNCIGVNCIGYFNYNIRQCGPVTTAIIGPQQPIVNGTFYFHSDGIGNCLGYF